MDIAKSLSILVFFLGAYVILKFIVGLIKLLKITFFGTQVSINTYGKDSWAVVTGSTDGIGK
jgi:hypothetical protein